MQSIKLLVCGLLCLLLASAAWGQGVGTSGEIRGTVVDQIGAVIAKTTLVALDIAKGIQHIATADSSGIAGLPLAFSRGSRCPR